jgi:pantothenate kinase
MKSIQSKTEDRKARSDDETEQLRLLLDEIEREEVPERLLELAKQLQTALTARRNTRSQRTG